MSTATSYVYLRAALGTGVMSLPIAMKHAGLALGPLLVVVAGLLSLLAVHLQHRTLERLRHRFALLPAVRAHFDHF